jgi:ADP-ribose pyrophosphatase YjhB (NUDIX family)
VVAPLRVVAAAILDGEKLLLVSKREAPDVFYLPGGKPDSDESPLQTLARELDEELGVTLIHADLFGVVSDEAALERVAMEMQVYLVRVGGLVSTGAEIVALAWVGANGDVPGTLAPAIRNQVLPELAARRLIT